MKCLKTIALLLLTLACCLHAQATLQGVHLGSHVCGPAVSANDLQGKVVLFEYWGVNCPPCVASISHLTHLQEEYGRDNFIIIANHCQGGGIDNTSKVWKSKATNDLVSVVDGGSLPQSNVTGIPRCFLFNHEGKLVYDGHPREVDAALKEAMDASPGAVVAGMEYKHFAKHAKAIGSQRGAIGKLLEKLAEVKADEEGHEEAAFLLERVYAYADKQKAIAETAMEDDPVKAMQIMLKMAGWLKGDDRADWFKDQGKALKKTDAFKDALKATKMLASVRAQADKIGLSQNPKQIKSVKSKHNQVHGVAVMLKTIEEKFPGTKAATEAADLRAAWGLQ